MPIEIHYSENAFIFRITKTQKNKSKFYSLKESTICEILVIKSQEYLREQVYPDVILEARGVTFFTNLLLNARIFKRALA